MKIGILDSVLNQPVDTLYTSAAQLGLEGVELGVFDKYATSDLWSEDGRKSICGYASSAGITTCSVCVHTFWLHSFAHPEEAERSLARTICLEAIEAAAGVGAGNILVPLTNPNGAAEPDEARDRWIAGVSSCAQAAEDAGVVLCLENVNQAFADRAEDVSAIVDAIDSPAVRVYFDAANAMKSGLDPVHEVEVLDGRIQQAHVKEFGGTLLGEGTVPWQEVVGAFRTVKFDGWLVFETVATDDPMQAAQKNTAHLNAVLAA